jgi:MFS family permease
MAVVDDTIVTIALPSMGQDLGFSGPDAQWIFNGYMLAFGGFLILFGPPWASSTRWG